MMRLLAQILVALLVLATSLAHAHTRSQSLSRWDLQGDVLNVRVEADAVDATRLYAMGDEETPLEARFAQEVDTAFAVTAAGTACSAEGETQAALLPGGRIAASLRFVCPEGAATRGPIEIESQLFLRVAPSHLHFVALRTDEGAIAETVLTASRPRAEMRLDEARGPASFWETMGAFIITGAEHVWSGIDHVAFILSLVLISAGRLRTMIIAATGFTLGHTATLGLAALGVLRPDTVAVEALIGFTIAFVALQAGDNGPQRMRAWSAPMAAALAIAGIASLFGLGALTPLIFFGLAVFVYAYPRGFPTGAIWLPLAFGLIHGCGFAGALGALELPQAQLLSALFGFNIGVELGQAAIIAAAALLIPLFKNVRAARLALPFAGAFLFALGVYWFIGRLL